jgi:hypothetical protein
LVVQPDERRQVGRAYTAEQQLLRARDAQMGQIRVRRHSDLRAKRATQVELVELCVDRKIVEPDRISEVLAQVLLRAAHGTRIRRRVTDQGERADRLGDRDLERQPIATGADRIDQPMKRCRALRQLEETLAAKPLTAELLAEVEAIAPRGAVAGTRYPAAMMSTLDSEKR